jgi:hypothetical protein
LQGSTIGVGEVEGFEWDPNDPLKKKVKKARRFSFEQLSNSKKNGSISILARKTNNPGEW